MKKVLYLILGILIFPDLLSQDTIFLNSKIQDIPVLENIYLFVDKENNKNIEDIISLKNKFEKNHDRTLNFGYSLAPFWLHFSLCNTSQSELNYILSITNPDLNCIEFYEISDQNIRKIVTGEKEDFFSRDIPHKSFSFKITLEPSDIKEIYIKINSEGEANYVPLFLKEEKEFYIYEEKDSILKWLFFGFLLFVIFFNFYLYKSINDSIYLHYALYILFGALFFFAFDGYLAYLNIPKITYKAKTLIPAMFAFFLLNFSQIFLDSKHSIKILNLIFNILKVLTILAGILFFFQYPLYTISIASIPIIGSIAYIAILIGSILSYNRKNKPSVFFFWAFLSILVCTIIFQIKEFGFLPANMLFENSMRFGMMIETGLLTLAVIERFQLQQQEAKTIIELNYTQIRNQKRQLEKANIELEKLSIVARETDNSIAIYDDKYNLEWCNFGFEKLYETSYEEMYLGNKINIFDFYGEKKDHIYDNINNNQAVSFENKTVNKLGKTVWTQTTLSPYIGDNGILLKIIAIDSDISKLKKYQEEITLARDKAEESDRLKSAFLSNMSHEIRTPLNAILGFSELLREDRTAEKKERYINLIKNNGYHLLKIINDILDISKIESNQMVAQSTKERINKILTDLYDYFIIDKTLLSKDLKLILTKPESNDIILTDHSKIRQVLENLIINSIKFTLEGKIEYGASVTDNKIRYFVKDTGLGIDPANHKKIFERFWQSEQGLSRKYEGSGLGLSISKGIIECLDGKIWVESEPNKGSVFYFEIPYIPVNSVYDENITHYPVRIKDKSILIVEDLSDSAMLFQEMLAGSGAELTFASNGKQALELALKYDYHFILMDLRLPDIDGVNVAMMILEKKPGIRIIAQTANISDNERQRCLNNGFAGYINKPIDQAELFKLFNSILDKT